MSKQSEEKTRQGYSEQQIFPMCGTCLHYSSARNDYGAERQQRCLLGGFSVKKTAACHLWVTRKP